MDEFMNDILLSKNDLSPTSPIKPKTPIKPKSSSRPPSIVKPQSSEFRKSDILPSPSPRPLISPITSPQLPPLKLHENISTPISVSSTSSINTEVYYYY